jgi:hypothetical protein
VQTPAWHVADVGHEVLQSPHAYASVCVSTQPLLHSVRPAGHAHVPLVQVVPDVQVVQLAPQLALSVRGSTQFAPHMIRGGVHVETHDPPLHT